MFESKTPLRETEAAFLFVRVNAARGASFRHDRGSAWGASELATPASQLAAIRSLRSSS